MARTIIGLTADEQDILNELVDTLRRKGPRNRIRTSFMDSKALAKAISPMIPPYLRQIGTVLGWPAKAVDALARRTRLTGFAIPGAELSKYDLDLLIDDNHYMSEVKLTQVASLTHAVAWEVVTKGGPGEPDAMITSKSALDGTGIWNKRTRRLDAFLSVAEWRTDGQDPTEFALYLPGQAVIVADGRVQDRSLHQLHVPVQPLPYKPRLDRPFGQSRITRPVMGLTSAGIRAMLRMEGTADFYGTPHLLLLGAAIEQFTGGDASATASWSWLLNQVNGLPDADDAATDELTRTTVEQIQQGSQQPHLDTIDTIAAAFAGETNIPVSSLGVGVKQANPTSEGSYEASREDLIGEAEDAADCWGHAHVRTLQDAWLIASGERVLPPELRKLQPIWRDPRQTSRSAAADASTKLVSVFDWMKQSDAILETIGLPAPLVERLKQERATITAAPTGSQLLTDALNRQASAPNTAG